MLRITVVAVCFSALCGALLAQRESYDQALVKLFGDEMLAILDVPDRVESFRVKPEHASPDTPDSLKGYPILRRGPDLSRAQATTMHQLLFDPNNHPPIVSSCLFQPGVALRYVKGERNVTILLCFKCKDWYFSYGDRDVSESFHDIQHELAAVVKGLFPDDAQIQSLP